jgi:hypothetical protein
MDQVPLCFVEFSVDDLNRFEALSRVFKALMQDKEKQIAALDNGTSTEVFRKDSDWVSLFDKEARSHFQWSAEELTNRPGQGYSDPREIYSLDSKRKGSWSLAAMIEAFKNGEYELIACRLISSDKARLEFSPLGFPYGGTECMKVLIEAFGFRVLSENDGARYYEY